MTIAERKLWWSLRQIKFSHSHFRRQATIGSYIVDFASHGRKLVIELDGGQHGKDEQARRDQERDGYFRRHGYRVLRFWNSDVLNNIEGVASMIAEAIEQMPPPTPDPSPPLRGGRGTITSQRAPRRPSPSRGG
jgi:very-short-patch-repair endonuclease